ncbi:MAG: bifunctional diaminohydroxyphosphoribosylaminopyrimidine deaminase/5-amino-6-(5-phosphoribosylamino)uracil reductase RibD [Pyrinomonadaceae bacterium]
MTTRDNDLRFLSRALDLAEAGVGQVSPNPLVGCVVVDRDGNIIGEGSYFFDRVKHAEVIALEQAGERARGGTAYVSLEPHDHHNRTPPCTEALIDAGITRVVATIEDPNPLVSGQGFARLRAAGIEVVTGLLAERAARQNEKFICWHRNRRPFVHLKLAASLDGRISLGKSVSTRLSGPEAVERVQRLRHEHDAILIGGTTAFVDDPSLTDRSGLARRRPLVRVVLDGRLRLPLDSTLVRTANEVPTVVISDSTDSEKREQLGSRGVKVVETDPRDISAVLARLREMELQSVLVEGGTQVAGAFCDARLVDKVTFLTAPLIIGGEDAPVAIGGRGAACLSDALQLKDLEVTPLGRDLEITSYPA